MRIAGTPIPVRDLTRWNRAGLERFRYVEGGAAEWREYLRVAHLLLYAGNPGATASDDPDIWRQGFEDGTLPGGVPIGTAMRALDSRWAQPAPQAYVRGAASYAAALRAQYDAVPLDHGAQISRAFVRAFHILTETLNAYANEGFLGTATQEPHLRRLLEMIAFRPSLPSSAQLPLAVLMKPEAARQVLPRGFAAEHVPRDGGPLLTFESLEDLTVDPGLNALRPLGWDQRLDPIPAGATALTLSAPSILNAAGAGSLGVLADGAALEGVEVIRTSKAEARAELRRGARPVSGHYQSARLHLAPALTVVPRPTGSYWLNFEADTRCYVGQVLGFSTDPALGDRFTILPMVITAIYTIGTGTGTATAAAAPAPSPSGSGTPPPPVSGTGVTAVGSGLATVVSTVNWIGYLPEGLAEVVEVRGRDVRVSRPRPAGLTAVFPAQRSVVVKNPEGHPPGAPDRLVLGDYVIPESAEPVGELQSLAADWVYLAGARPAGVADGAAVAMRLRDGRLWAAPAQGVQAHGSGWAMRLALPTGATVNDIAALSLGFAGDSGLAHLRRSDAPLFAAGEAAAVLTLPAPASGGDLLRPGRRLLLAADPETLAAGTAPLAAAVTVRTAASDAAGNPVLTLAEAPSILPPFRRGHVLVHGNALLTGHGKSLPEQVLGSGDGAIDGQVLDLPPGPVATRPDPAFPGGVAADLELTAQGRLLRQVASAEAADPLQPSYVVQLTDRGDAQIRLLTRVATGTDDLRLTRYRSGAGKAGNAVPPLSITKPVPRHPAVAALLQPLAPQFGADLEGVAALRANGGSQFALMDRALAPEDFARLAAGHAAIWHAGAELRREAGSLGRPLVVLAVVPAGGGPVAPLRAELTAYLAARALPGTRLQIDDFTPAPVGGRAVVTLKPGYPRSMETADEIRAILMTRFSLEARTLGRTLFTTELTAAIEAHPMVAHLVFTLQPRFAAGSGPRRILAASGALQALVPDRRTAVFIEQAGHVTIDWAMEGAP